MREMMPATFLPHRTDGGCWLVSTINSGVPNKAVSSVTVRAFSFVRFRTTFRVVVFSIRMFSQLAGGKKKASTSGMMVEAVSQRVDEGLGLSHGRASSSVRLYDLIERIISPSVKLLMSRAGH